MSTLHCCCEVTTYRFLYYSIQALAKLLGDDAQEILQDAMHNLALPKSEVLKKEGKCVTDS